MFAYLLRKFRRRPTTKLVATSRKYGLHKMRPGDTWVFTEHAARSSAHSLTARSNGAIRFRTWVNDNGDMVVSRYL